MCRFAAGPIQLSLKLEGDLSMKKHAALVAAVGLAMWILPAFGQEAGWSQSQEYTSHGLASAGWQFLGASGLSWPDGRQAIVTFWNSSEGQFVRCFDYFDANMSEVRGNCQYAEPNK
jgi:hypothetical protein